MARFILLSAALLSSSALAHAPSPSTWRPRLRAELGGSFRLATSHDLAPEDFTGAFFAGQAGLMLGDTGLGLEASFGIAPASPTYFAFALLSDGELLGQRATFSFALGPATEWNLVLENAGRPVWHLGTSMTAAFRIGDWPVVYGPRLAFGVGTRPPSLGQSRGGLEVIWMDLSLFIGAAL